MGTPFAEGFDILENENVDLVVSDVVMPGLTGWAQINGRNAITWEKKFKLDGWYADNQSLRLDLKIMGMTFLKVLKREGISQEGEATMSKFNPQTGKER